MTMDGEMNETVRKRVAKAIAKAYGCEEGESWEAFEEQFNMAADYAIEAIRVPTPEMVKAGQDGSISEAHVRGIWDLMIDAMLADEPETENPAPDPRMSHTSLK
jgi:hypothetical protein